MATAHLDMLHTAALRLREAADRFVVAFEQAAAEATGSTPVAPVKRQRAKPRLSPTRKTLRSPSAVQITSLAGTERGITAAEVARVLEVPTRSAHGRLAVLATRGHLVRVALPGQTVRFFAQAEHATAWGAPGGPAEPEPADTSEVLEVGLRQAPHQLAAMVEADAPAVAKALAVIAPQPAPSAPPPQPYIPPTPSRARGERREHLAAAAFVAPVAKPEGEVIVPPTAKITRAPTPVDGRFTVDPKLVGQDPESFSAQWARLRGVSTA